MGNAKGFWFGLAFAIFHFSPVPASPALSHSLSACASNRVNCCEPQEPPLDKPTLSSVCEISLSYINQANLPETSAKSNANGEFECGSGAAGGVNPEKSNQLKSYSIHFAFPSWNERHDCGKSHSGSHSNSSSRLLSCPLISKLYIVLYKCIYIKCI